MAEWTKARHVEVKALCESMAMDPDEMRHVASKHCEVDSDFCVALGQGADALDVLPDALSEIDRLTAQVREAEARWDKLEETVQQMFQRASGLENGHDLPFDDVLAEMARLERQCCERDHDFDGNCDRHPASLREPPPAREGETK